MELCSVESEGSIDQFDQEFDLECATVVNILS